MEAILILLGVGLLLFIPIGSVLGFLAFRKRNEQASRIDALSHEVASLHLEVAELRLQNRQAPPEASPSPSRAQRPEQPREIIPEQQAESERRAVEKAIEAQWSTSRSHAEVETDDWIEPREPSRFIAALKENWMVWLGGLSVALAGIFMVSHSINAGLIGPAQQLLLALFTGLALHAGAEYLRRRHMSTDQVFAALAGGGSVTLYAALLAGVYHYDLIGPVIGLIALAVVSLATMALALVHGPLLAIMGLSGAYLVPLLIGGEDGSVTFVLSYSFLITLSSLLLMRYVFRDWLWYATLAGALLWWAVTVVAAPTELATACYLAVLFVVFAFLPGQEQAAPSRLREAFLPILAIWGISIAHQTAGSTPMWSWLLLLPAAILVPQSRGALWFLPWAAVLATAAGWLLYVGGVGDDFVYLLQLPMKQQAGFISYLMVAAITSTGLGLWQWGRFDDKRRWASLTLLSPLVWLILGWLLLHGYGETSTVWAVVTLLLGGVYGALAWQMEGRARYGNGVVWAVLAAHVSYSLATVMAFREASLTLALSVQFVSLTWLARRYQMPELYLLLKGVLALVVARLTFNPWLQGYDASVHWSLWTYGGATLLAAVATRLADKNHSIRPWLEGATLHLLVLFLGTELRYWLYDGNIFIHEYSLTEATLNALLWGALSVTYAVRAKTSQSLTWLYRLFSWILLALSSLSYLALITIHNPWWSEGTIGDTPIFNMLLPAFGGPVLLALVISRFPEIAPKIWSLCVAAAGFLLFTALEIRQLWQGSDMAFWFGMTEGELYTYSVVGMLYAIAAIIYSTVYSAKSAHIMLYKAGMALLGMVIGKIFLLDMAGLQGLWRVAAFMGLGLALLGLAWMYRKAQRTSEQAS
ncbi:DUF2339 domain-containing protein [Marinobacter sp. 1_MG-2023]|uniref:DUF2339 domain-containing protein n=1 Tax=Marinobacter sp. 1_MG-2023 TaxID=3062627 RepID=UPI0026E17B24|nr:DUF2339 domain-containing protein [Marinobacter sp. 1_MG-2023]MDO6823053.1 DUF2339 domain-containing protein [Marinobacter sp. 1_MG-2023]